MINSIGLKNFKGFKNLDSLPIKPITILAGTNSCGKSSILQSILLAKQTIESKNPNQILLLNGRFVHLGTFENVIYEKNLNNSVTIEYCFKISKSDLGSFPRGRIPLHFILRDILSNEAFEEPKAEYLFKYCIDLIPEDKKKRKSLIKPIRIQNVNFELIVKRENGDTYKDMSISFSSLNDGIFIMKWDNFKLKYWTNKNNEKHRSGEAKVSVDFANLLPIAIRSSEGQNEPSNMINYFFYQLQELFKSITSSITYIGPLREEPSRRYIYEDEITEIGIKGENAAYILYSEQDDELIDHYFFNYEKNLFSITKKCTLLEAISYWNNIMNINNFSPDAINEIIQLNLSSSSSGKTRVNIADVGFGVSQIFPIILEGLRMKGGNTLLLEQPEIHLHPNLQMQLADYFISLALSNKKVIIETHSDHIINRLVRRIIECNDDRIKNLIGIYFITPTNDGTKYEEISIDENRGLINWPKDFFDQASSEQEQIMKASINKYKNRKI